MSEQNERRSRNIISRNQEAGHGGLREGAGRPQGRRNNATLARERIMAEALRNIAAAIPNMTPLEATLGILRAAVAAGDVDRALHAAHMALPYVHARQAPVTAADPNAPTPLEIAADDDPEMDDEPRFGEPLN